MFYSLATMVFGVFTVAVCGFAFTKGGQTEKIFAGAYVVAWLASLAFQLQTPDSVFPWIVFGIDVFMLGLYGVLAWRGPAWVVWATALQALSVASHIMNLFVVSPSVNAFYTVLNLTAWGILVALAVGTFWAWQERKAAGFE